MQASASVPIAVMDPSRTLVAFHFETDPSVTTVHLIGSWDGFSSSYAMDRDARRGRGHWRGCHSLQDRVCCGAGSRYKMHTGLAMGHTYYYYVCCSWFAPLTNTTASTVLAAS
ncbi:hypothetical protein HC256_008350 [Beauveria bassiana]|nr:hypothetical protein HC256_008350 [Beauveria bassiana]